MIRTLVAIAAVLACSACGDTSTTTEDNSSFSGSEQEKQGQRGSRQGQGSQTGAAKGPIINGTGYRYRVPKGWGPLNRDVPGFDFDSVAIDRNDRDAFTDNVNVILAPAGTLTPEQAETAGRRELESVGAKNVTVHPRVTIAGGTSAHLAAGMSMNDNGYLIEQYYPSAAGQTLVVTFSFSPDVSAAERTRVTQATLASWTWGS